MQAIRTVSSHKIVLNRRDNTVISRALLFQGRTAGTSHENYSKSKHSKSKCMLKAESKRVTKLFFFQIPHSTKMRSHIHTSAMVEM
jgi:hypothetical protein